MARNPIPDQQDRFFTLPALPAGILLQLHITAANDAGETIPGPNATITLR